MTERNDGGRFAPGQCGNPAGRPKGSRNRLSEAFIAALCEDFDQHGAATIVRMREEDPVSYVKVLASILPKQLQVQDDTHDLSDEELLQRISQIDQELGGLLRSTATTAPNSRGTHLDVDRTLTE